MSRSRYGFTRHARTRMRRDEISEDDVITAIEQPDQTETEDNGRLNAWKRLEGDWLKVVYVVEPRGTIVITVTRKRKGPTG